MAAFAQKDWELIANALNTEALRLEHLAKQPRQNRAVLMAGAAELRAISKKACDMAWPKPAQGCGDTTELETVSGRTIRVPHMDLWGRV